MENAAMFKPHKLRLLASSMLVAPVALASASAQTSAEDLNAQALADFRSGM
jgi:hypothetical protein